MEHKTIHQLIDAGAITYHKDGNHGGNYPKPEDFVDEGIPLITGANLNEGRIDLTNCSFIKHEVAEKLRIGKAVPGDLLLTHKGTMGKTAKVGDIDFPFIVVNPQIRYSEAL